MKRKSLKNFIVVLAAGATACGGGGGGGGGGCSGVPLGGFALLMLLPFGALLRAKK